MSISIPLQRSRVPVLADLIAARRDRATRIAWDIALVIGAAALVGALAQISIKLSFTPVPITGQTLGVLLAGTSLGLRRGAAALALYAVAGVAGVPWFAGHASGYTSQTIPSFGYIIGFFLAAALCGFLAERGADRSVLGSVPAMIAGEIVMYAVGVAWLAVDLHVSAGKAISLGFTPFVIGDAIKAAIAALLLPAAWKLAGRGRSGAGQE